MYRSRAAARLRHDWPSGNAPNASTPTDLSHDPFERIVGADLLPVDVGEGVVGQRLVDVAFDQIGRRVHLGGPQVVDDRPGLAVSRVAVLLGMDRLEHM